MPKPRPSAAIRDMLVEREIALWDAHNYNTATGRPTAKDPVSVCLKTPLSVDLNYYGRGPTCDEAVINALVSNNALNFKDPGVLGAMARLEIAVAALDGVLFEDRYRRKQTLGTDDLDDDIPF